MTSHQILLGPGSSQSNFIFTGILPGIDQKIDHLIIRSSKLICQVI
ncbi:MAG TPA: hypothetical protein VFT44_22275 [Pyrinomonadaceae bacterium]|nr:hypothetical protein [Pyrinomonadaceae bacterium]